MKKKFIFLLLILLYFACMSMADDNFGTQEAKINIARRFYDSKTHNYTYDFNDFELKPYPNYNEYVIKFENKLFAIDEKGKAISNYKLKWTSSDEKILKIDEHGKITVLGFGVAKITASSDTGINDSISVAVQPVDNLKICSFGNFYHINSKDGCINDAFEISNNYNTSVDLFLMALSHKNGKDYYAVYETLLTWSSSDESVATVKDGKVKIIGYGETEISVSLPTGMKTSFRLIVSNRNVSVISIGRRIFDVTADSFITDTNDFDLKYKTDLCVFAPLGNALCGKIKNNLLTWTSSDENVVTVNRDGEVTAVGVGVATITASLPNGTKDTVNINVPKTNQIYIRCKNSEYSNEIDYNTLLLYGYDYLYAEDKNGNDITGTVWQSSDQNVATVSSEGKVTATGIGETLITAECNGFTDKIKIKVLNYKNGNVGRLVKKNSKTGIIEYDFNDFELKNTDYLNLIDICGCIVTNLDCRSLNENAVKISSEGKIEAVGFGEATIQLNPFCGGVSSGGTIKITVPPISSRYIKICRNIFNKTTGKSEYDYSDFILKDQTNLYITDDTGEEISPNLFSWSSSDERVAVVSKDGIVTPTGIGVAKITAVSIQGNIVKGEINIRTESVPSENYKIKIGRILGLGNNGDRNYDFSDFQILNSYILNLTDENNNPLFEFHSERNKIRWTSADEKVATVNGSDCIKAVGFGKTKITASVNGFTDTINVTVPQIDEIYIFKCVSFGLSSLYKHYNKIEINSISLINGSILDCVLLGARDKFGRKISPTLVKWTSSDNRIIKILDYDGDVRLKALNFGVATVTASLPNGVKDTVTVTVPYPKKIYLYAFDNNYLGSINANDFVFSGQGELHIMDENGKEIPNYLCKWTSSDKTIIDVVSGTLEEVGFNSGKLKQVGFGTATITAILPNGVKDSINITVHNPKSAKLCVYDYSEKKYIYDNFMLSDTEKLFILDENGNEAYNKLFKWTSSDTKIVKVNENGVAEAFGVGSAVITATKPDGCSASINVTVPGIKSENLTLDHDKLTIIKWKPVYLKATVYPSDAAFNKVKWLSSNPDIASVDDNGKILATKSGTVIITATTKEKTATCKVTVLNRIK